MNFKTITILILSISLLSANKSFYTKENLVKANVAKNGKYNSYDHKVINNNIIEDNDKLGNLSTPRNEIRPNEYNRASVINRRDIEELSYHDGIPDNGYYQSSVGYGVIFDLSSYGNVSLELVDFSHYGWGFSDGGEYNIFVVNMDDGNILYQTNGEAYGAQDINVWVEGIDIGGIIATSNQIGVFLQPLSDYSSATQNDWYPCLDSDESAGSTNSGIYDFDTQAFTYNTNVGDFLMDLWIDATSCDEENLITCWDGSCALTEADCPMEWSIGMECGTGQDGWPNCGDADGDDVDDCVDLVLGCGLAYCFDPISQGDGTCDDLGDLNDDGVNEGMNCEYFSFDGGDCVGLENCASSGGNISWLGDGFCDDGEASAANNNTEECQWDGGDCCCLTCTDTDDWDCEATATGVEAGDCLDPAINANDEADCLSLTCEDQNLITCFDGTCEQTEADCPIEWSIGMECGTGQEGWPNCGDDDGDDVDDCVGLVLGCGLAYCIDPLSQGDGICDDFGDLNGDGINNGINCEEFNFDDGDCLGSEDCIAAGGNISWQGDGYCDAANNNEGCNYDNGDCCASTCIDNDTTEETYGCDSCSDEGGSGCGDQSDLDGDGLWDSCIDPAGSGPSCIAGDVNGDENINVSDIVLIVNIIINSETNYPPCADYNSDGIVNVLDIVQVVSYILGGGSMGANATHGNLEFIGNDLILNTDGIISGIQMTITHSENFEIELGDSFYSNYNTNGLVTKIVIINPEDKLLFEANSTFEISEVLAANSNGYVDLKIVEPNQYLLTEVYPNPFNPTTNITLQIPKDGLVKVNLYNIAGKLVTELYNNNLIAGTHSLELDGNNLPSGLYLLQTISGIETATNKIMLMK